MPSTNYYAVLGLVSRTVNVSIIKRQFRTMVKRWHPDNATERDATLRARLACAWPARSARTPGCSRAAGRVASSAKAKAGTTVWVAGCRLATRAQAGAPSAAHSGLGASDARAAAGLARAAEARARSRAVGGLGASAAAARAKSLRTAQRQSAARAAAAATCMVSTGKPARTANPQARPTLSATPLARRMIAPGAMVPAWWSRILCLAHASAVRLSGAAMPLDIYRRL